LNNVLLSNIVEPESGVTILFNIVDNCEQCGQQSIVTSARRLCNHLGLYVCVYVCVYVCMCMCVFVCEHDNSRNTKHIHT
jgi:hypothetical protein